MTLVQLVLFDSAILIFTLPPFEALDYLLLVLITLNRRRFSSFGKGLVEYLIGFEHIVKMPSIARQRHSTRSNSSSTSNYDYNYSDGSEYSVSTTPTVHSEQPSVRQYKAGGEACLSDSWNKPRYSHHDRSGPTASAATYASTTSSTEDLHEDLPPFEVSDDRSEVAPSTALASSPSEFAEYFPSTQRLSIKHDDATIDGNMNLRIDTEVQTTDGGKADLTLFHLRMHDLKRREFSLRRYCRDSGREVCHSSRKFMKPSVIRRPGLQRSMSHALSNLRSKSDTKTPTITSLKRHDSGYDSMPDEEVEDVEEEDMIQSPKAPSESRPTNTTQLEFSNYAHLEVKRRGAKTHKRYEFEYWGTKYAWKRVAVKSGNFKEISYHLFNTQSSASCAHIVPTPLTNAELRQEEAKGGWIRPCSMWISDEKLLDKSSDVAE